MDGQIFTDIGSFTSLTSSLENLENMLEVNMVAVSTSLNRLQQSEQAPITENLSPVIMVPSFAGVYLDQTVHQFEFAEDNRMSSDELVAVNNQEEHLFLGRMSESRHFNLGRRRTHIFGWGKTPICKK
ncbi:hypothetical protein Adt_17709 [Abeliophyllum distichum]|uniref:Uncharacterized protein n=1 Tax=Abeliophyllum distichum TaxID=126358 RepID=A0ABD1THI9_9LAMI